MLKAVYVLLGYLRERVSRFTKQEVMDLVCDIKDAWLEAFKDHTTYRDFVGEGLSEDVSLIQVGVLAAKERLASLIQKVGAMKHEVQQLFELDFLPARVRARLKDAIRTRDASPLVRCHGWEGWLQFALMYRNVSVRTDPQVVVPCRYCRETGLYRGEVCPKCRGKRVIKTTMMRYYNTKGICAKCAGTGKISMRVKLKTPIKHKLNTDDVERKVIGLKDGIPIYHARVTQHYDVITHTTKRRKCARCKGTGKSAVKNTKRFPCTFDLVDIIEMTGIMQALYVHTEGQDGGICGHSSKEDDLPSHAGPGYREAGDFHDRMHFNLSSDHSDRENEEGGDINTNPQDRTFNIERDFEATIDDLRTYDPDISMKLGYKPKFFTTNGIYRGPINVGNVRPYARSHDREYLGESEPSAFRWVDTVLTKFSDGYGEFQRLVLDRIYNGAFKWDPEFYWFLDKTPRKDYLTGTYKTTRYSTLWARLSIPVDTEIAKCLADNVRKDIGVVEVSITGDMAQMLYNESDCPRPVYTIMFDTFISGVKYKIPVAHRDVDGKWHVCRHVKRARVAHKYTIKDGKSSVESVVTQGFYDRLLPYLRTKRWVIASRRSGGKTVEAYGPIIRRDHVGGVSSSKLLKNCILVESKRQFTVRENKYEKEGE